MAISNFWSVDDSPSAITFATTLRFKTGRWRHLRPVYLPKAAPCREACPAGVDMALALEHASQGRFAEAAQIIRDENPLAGVCGRVCPHPCEEACNRKEFDAPLAMKEMERFLADQGWESAPPVSSAARKESRVAVVGSGPAGLSCAYFLSRLGYRVTLYEAARQLGGVLRTGIPQYRLPKEALDREIRGILNTGVQIKVRKRLGAELRWEELRGYAAVFLAPGFAESRRLNLANEDAAGVISGIDFLRQVNERRFRPLGKAALVIGGGDVAVDAGRCALRQGYLQVTIVSLETREEMPAVAEAVAEAEQEGLKLVCGAAPVKITTRSGATRAVEFVEGQLTGFGPDGQPRLEKRPGSGFSIPADLLITAVGQRPELGILPEEVKTGPRGILVDEWGQTSLAGVYAGGDVTEAKGTVVAAIASGKKAALAIDRNLAGKGTEEISQIGVGRKGSISFASYINGEEPADLSQVVACADINLDYFENQDRLDPKKAGSKKRLASFAEVNLGFGAEDALKEGARCFNCGRCTKCDNCLIFCPDVAITRDGSVLGYQINYDYCKGCALCVQECPRRVVTTIEEQP